MPSKTITESRRAYLRRYQRQWMARRRAAWFAGKVCAFCGSDRDLELDHIDPAQKVSHAVWSWSDERRAAELAKCRPLCKACHKKRSDEQMHTPVVHGTTAGYGNARRPCRCDLCRAARREYLRQLRQRQRAAREHLRQLRQRAAL